MTPSRSLKLALRALIPALLLSTPALAATSSTPVALNVTALNSCVFDAANASPTIDVTPDYQAGSVPTGLQGQVSVSVYCNKGTPVTGRTLTGTTSTSTANTHVGAVLTQFSPGVTDTLNAEVWFIAGSSAPVASGIYKGATRTATVINTSWPSAGQFGASTGFYTGDVNLVISF